MPTESSIEKPFASVMAAKSDDELRNVVSNKHKYEFEAYLAAVEELERRNLATPELLKEKAEAIENEKLKRQEQQANPAGLPGNANGSSLQSWELFKIKKDYVITPLIGYATVLVFIVMVIGGVGAFEPSVESLILWGGNLRPLTLDGQPWRLFTAIFLHGGIIHLLLNMMGLLQLGAILEADLGKYRYLLIYVATGILASITSIAINDNVVSVGASGAIFGLDGLLLALLITKQLNIPQESRKNLLTTTLAFIGYNLVFGFTKEGIDNAAHIGGLVSGFIIGFLYSPSLKRGESSTVVSAVIAGVVLVAVLAAPRFISNKYGEYQTAMETFSVNEEKALWMYKENLPLAKSAEAEQYSQRLQTEGIDLWKQNLSLLNSLADMPDHLQSRIDLLKKYCELRIELCEAMRQSVNGEDESGSRVTELDSEIGTIIKQLEALDQ